MSALASSAMSTSSAGVTSSTALLPSGNSDLGACDLAKAGGTSTRSSTPRPARASAVRAVERAPLRVLPARPGGAMGVVVALHTKSDSIAIILNPLFCYTS